MKGLINRLSEDRLVYRFFLFSLILHALSLVYVLLFFRSLPPLMPVYNQLPWGPSRLGGTFEIFVPIAASLGVMIVNMTLYRFIHTKMPLLSRMLGATMLLTSLLTLIFLFRIIQLII